MSFFADIVIIAAIFIAIAIFVIWIAEMIGPSAFGDDPWRDHDD